MPDLDVSIRVTIPEDQDGRAALRAAQRAMFLLAIEIVRRSETWDIDGVKGKVRRPKQ
jgi:hypothetical protein